MVTAAGIVMMLGATAEFNGGFFDPAWLHQANFAELLAVLPREAVWRWSTPSSRGTWTSFAARTPKRRKTPLPHLDRYAFNPLTSRPFVRLRTDG